MCRTLPFVLKRKWCFYISVSKQLRGARGHQLCLVQMRLLERQRDLVMVRGVIA